jgi:ribonuclease VapC
VSLAFAGSSSCVLDASALLAFLHDEPGGELVEPELGEASISSVNWAEVVQKSLARGADWEGLRGDLEALGLVILPFTAEGAEAAAELWPETHSLGLSLAGRACLAVAKELSLPVLTTDSAWEKLEIGVSIRVIR